MELGAVLIFLRNLGSHNADYVLVGGAALNVLGIVRATEDVNIFIEPSVSNIERVKESMRATWHDPAIEEIKAEDILGEYPVIRHGPPESDFTIDLLSRLGDAFRFKDLGWQWTEIAGVAVKVATPETLYRMKASTLRLQDQADAARLKERYGLE